jgi:hypothetical protein
MFSIDAACRFVRTGAHLNPGLFKCPAMDKPICNPDYTGTPVECLKIDKNGSIMVQQLQTQ